MISALDCLPAHIIVRQRIGVNLNINTPRLIVLGRD